LLVRPFQVFGAHSAEAAVVGYPARNVVLPCLAHCFLQRLPKIGAACKPQPLRFQNSPLAGMK